MKKVALVLGILLIAGAVAMAAGAKEGAGKAAPGITQPVTLKLGHTMPPTHPSQEACLALAAEVAEKTKGLIKIDVFPAAQLGGAKDLIEGTMRGTQDFAFDGPGVISQFFPKISVLDMPFLFADYGEFLKTYRSDFGADLRNELREKTGLRTLDVCYYGSRQISSNKPIRGLSDFKGFKIRVPEVQEPLESFRALGASPTPIAFGEVYFSLQTNVVDGQENPLTTIYTYKFYEVQKYITISNHQVATLWFLVNDKRWQSFSEEQKTIVTQAVRRALEAYDKKILDNESSLVDTLSKQGLQILKFSDADRAAIKNTIQQIYPKFEKKWGAGTVEKIQAVLVKN